MNEYATELVLITGVLTTLFWLVVAWRAMRAHERIAFAAENLAKATEQLGRELSKPKPLPPRRPRPKPTAPTPQRTP
ncbi:MAG: hypothetical protein AAGM22_21610 [Acidobacteriota bacterium]